MGEMADLAYEQVIYEQFALLEKRLYYKGLTVDELILELKELLASEDYEDNQYTKIVVDIYMAYESGYTLTSKQKTVIINHLLYTDN